MSLVCLESASLFRSALCPRLNPDRHNGDFLWALVVAWWLPWLWPKLRRCLRSHQKPNCVSSPSNPLYFPPPSTPLLCIFRGYLTGRGDIMTKIDAQEGRAARARCFKTADDGHFDTETVTVLSHKTHPALTT